MANIKNMSTKNAIKIFIYLWNKWYVNLQSMEYFTDDYIDDKSKLVWVMVKVLSGCKPLFESILTHIYGNLATMG